MNSILTVLLTIWIIVLLINTNDSNRVLNQKEHIIDSLKQHTKIQDKIIKDYQSRL